MHTIVKDFATTNEMLTNHWTLGKINRNRLGIRLSFQIVEKVVEKSWRASKDGSMCHSTASIG